MLCTYQCKPRGRRGGGGVRAMGVDLTVKSIPLVGGLIEYLCSGVGTFAFFFGRETGIKFQHGYIASSIFFGKGVEFGAKCSTITLLIKVEV